jgi:carbon-monoxide dehydrogenase medium subunit
LGNAFKPEKDRPADASLGPGGNGSVRTVKPAPFQLHRPSSLDGAIDLLARLVREGSEAKVVAGGQSLLPLMNFRLARPDHLVDLSGVEELHRISFEDRGVTIGAMVRQRDCLDILGPGGDGAERGTGALALLAEAVANIGHHHIRNRGTVGGSLAHADPAAELPAVALALDAELSVAGPAGRRMVPARDFFDGWFTTTLADDEVVVALHLPDPAEADGGLEWGFEELARRHGDFATVLVATALRRDHEDRVTAARVVLGGVGATPVRSTGAEAALVGSIGDRAFGPAAALARAGVDPVGDLHADPVHRAELVEVLVARALRAGSDRRRRRPPGQPADAGRSPAGGPGGPGGVAARVTASGSVVVNGGVAPLDGVPHRRLLADFLRDDCGLTGTHLGCEHGVCGACTVLLDDDPVRSCLVLAHQADGRRVTTIESIGTPEDLHPLQEAFRAHHGLQCGFCTPGMVLSALDLLRRHPDPDEATVRRELSGNLCRCTGYVKIVEAVLAAAAGNGAAGNGAAAPAERDPR